METMRKIGVMCLVALAILQSISVAAESPAQPADEGWPQFGGPNRDSVAANSPKLANSWPKNGPALVWKSDLIPGYTQGGCSGPVVADGKVFVYATAKKPVGGGAAYDIFTPDALASAGWLPGLPEELSKRIEAARLSPEHPMPEGASFSWWEIRNEVERNKAADEYLAKSPELDKFIRDFIATLTPEEALKYGAYIRYRFCARPKLDWNANNGLTRVALVELEQSRGQKFATVLESCAPVGAAWVKGGVQTPVFSKYMIVDKFLKSAFEKSFTRVDQLTCLDAATGKKLWATEIPMDDRTLAWFGTCDDSMWFQNLGACGTPAVAAGRCYFSGFTGLYCLSAKDGAILWKASVPPTQASVLVCGGVVYFAGVAYRADTGAELWRTPLWKKCRDANTSPVLWRADGKDYVVDVNGGSSTLLCLDLQTGKEAWTCKVFSRGWVPNWFALRRDGDLLTAGGTVYRMSPTAVTPVQTTVDGKPVMNGGIIDQGYLFQETHPGEGRHLKNQGVNCWDLKTGEDKWNCDVTAKDLKGVMSEGVRQEVWLGTEGYRLTPSILADGKILMSICDLPYYFWGGDKSMDVLMLRATTEKFEPLGCFAPGMIPWAPMALADGKLFIRTVFGISCYDLAEHGIYLEGVTAKKDSLAFRFKQTGGGLVLKDGTNDPKEVMITDAKGAAKPAKATMTGDTIVVDIKDVPIPFGISYAGTGALAGKNELPAPGFSWNAVRALKYAKCFDQTIVLTSNRPLTAGWNNAANFDVSGAKVTTVSVFAESVTLTTDQTWKAGDTVTLTYPCFQVDQGDPRRETLTFTAPEVVHATAKFVKTDETTSGGWKGVYGSEGAVVQHDAASVIPKCAAVTPRNQRDCTWVDTTQEARALLKSGDAKDRIAACWFSDTAFDIDVGTTDDKEHQVAVYFMDWDALGRAVKVEVRDAVSDAVLDTQTVMDFKNGKYLVWKIKGQASFHFLSTGKENATVSGVFVDPPGQAGK